MVKDVHLRIVACRETPLFYRRRGRLQQRLDVTLAGFASQANLTLRVEDEREAVVARHRVDGRSETITLPAFAPVSGLRRPSPRAARLSIVVGGVERAAQPVRIGSFRPWTLHVLSDVCADDIWAYDDIVRHDHDDYLTTRAEIGADAGNAYNLPATRQLERFLFHARPEEVAAARTAIRRKRLFVSLIPNQLNPAAFILHVYPDLLSPFRRAMEALGLAPARFAAATYHMEGPTWTAGLAKLLQAAGVQLFAKSLLRYQAPWIERLARIPRLTRYEVAPGQFVLFSLHCNGYSEAGPLLDQDVEKTNRFLHEELLPAAERDGADYPLSHLALAGMYGDLNPSSPRFAALKKEAIERYNSQGWAFPKIVNSTWTQFSNVLAREVGIAHAPRVYLQTICGDAGASWEGWMMAAQREHASFRALQRRLDDALTLCALLPELAAKIENPDALTLDVVHLGDHAWNGFDDGTWNASIYVRRRRIAAAEKNLEQLWKVVRETSGVNGSEKMAFAAVNTLGWDRDCEVEPLGEWGNPPPYLQDVHTGETFTPRKRADGGWRYFLPTIRAYGARIVERASFPTSDSAVEPPVESNPPHAPTMRPVLYIAGNEAAMEGSWNGPNTGYWRAGGLSVSAVWRRLPEEGSSELFLSVGGDLPDLPYELSWRVEMPWPSCRWLVESGGAFVVPGNTAAGGDSLGGVIGCVSAIGEGLQAIAPDGSALVWAPLESGLCGLGRRTTRISQPHDADSPPDTDSGPFQDCLETRARLYWFLLGSELNARECYRRQVGANSWQFRCRILQRRTALTPAQLYRYAAGVHRPAVLIPAARWPYGADSAVRLVGPDDLLPLGLRRSGGDVELNFFNAASTPVGAAVQGPLMESARVFSVNLLGGKVRRVAADSITALPENFGKILLKGADANKSDD